MRVVLALILYFCASATTALAQSRASAAGRYASDFGLAGPEAQPASGGRPGWNDRVSIGGAHQGRGDHTTKFGKSSPRPAEEKLYRPAGRHGLVGRGQPDRSTASKPRVYISGEVLKPGPILLKPPINIAQAIALAGGVSPFAASKRIQIHRIINGVETVLLFDYKAFQAGEPGENFMLRNGDVIIVPERGLLE